MYEFIQAIAEAGVTPPDSVVADGQLHRYKVDKNDTKKSGFYVLYNDGSVNGIFGCFKTGVRGNWFDGSEKKSEEELAEVREHIRIEKIKREKESQLKKESCRKKSKYIWSKSVSIGDSKYLERKQVGTNGARFTRTGDLAIPIRDTEGIIHGLQFITNDGIKKFIPGTSKYGNYFSIGKLTNLIAVCEGFATGSSIHECVNISVAVAFDAGNMLPVARSLKNKYPDVEIIVCADNDEVGINSANEINKKFGCKVFTPYQEGFDFNDLQVECGDDAVIEIFHNMLSGELRGP